MTAWWSSALFFSVLDERKVALSFLCGAEGGKAFRRHLKLLFERCLFLFAAKHRLHPTFHPLSPSLSYLTGRPIRIMLVVRIPFFHIHVWESERCFSCGWQQKTRCGSIKSTDHHPELPSTSSSTTQHHTPLVEKFIIIISHSVTSQSRLGIEQQQQQQQQQQRQTGQS